MKRSVLTLFSGENDVLSHILRLALTEKGIAYDVEHLNDTSSTPAHSVRGRQKVEHEIKSATILDRDLRIDDIHIALEYLDDKYPHPPLFPSGPEKKAKVRLIIKLIEQKAMKNIRKLSSTDSKEVAQAVDELSSFIRDVSAIFNEKTLQIFDEEFSVLDCYFAPILYKYFRAIQENKSFVLPPKIANYYRRIHSREQFLKSLQIAPSRGFMYEKNK